MTKSYDGYLIIVMNRILFCLLFAVPLVAYAEFRSTTEVLEERLTSSDVDVRRAAMKELVSEQPEDRAEKIIPLLVIGLKDSDEKTRIYAAGGARRVTAFKTLKPEIGQLVKESPELKQGLMNVIADDNRKVRENALAGLVQGYEPTREIEGVVLERLRVEQDKTVRLTLIESISVAGFTSPEAVDALIVALDDDSRGVRAMSALSITRLDPLPEKALPKLVELLQSEEVYRKVDYLRAIQAYGPAAEAYLPLMQEMLKRELEKETSTIYDDVFRENLTNTITTIKQSVGGDAAKGLVDNTGVAQTDVSPVASTENNLLGVNDDKKNEAGKVADNANNKLLLYIAVSRKNNNHMGLLDKT
jgi:HEAT repeat protein